jgi:hypothetical protein
LDAVAAIPGLLAIIWLLRRKSLHGTYLSIYLPALLLLPGWCRFVVPALPDPTFHESALLPIAAVFMMRVSRKWRPSFLDLLVVAFGLFIGYAEYANAGYKEAQNLMFDMIAAALMPYFVGQAMAGSNELRIAFVKRFVWLVALLACLLTFEFRFANNPYRMVFDHFFPGQGDGWVTTFRYGFARVAGPYGHAILAGIVFMFAFRLARWLEHSKLWEPRFKWFQSRFSKAQFVTVATLAGLTMTLVRGPQIGTLLAVAVSAMGKGRNPRRRARFVLAAVLLIGIPAGITAWSYASVGRAAAKDASQESAAYRKELIDKYVTIALDHATLGWGRNGWPKVPGMPSIDNYYLLLCLMHGVPAALLLVAILVLLQARLLYNGFRSAPAFPEGSSLSFTLAGIFTGFMFAILTVYMGDNVVPIFFTLVGFSEGYLKAGGDAAALSKQDMAAMAIAAPRFAHVIA